jgi:hypothetical protein
VANRTYSLPTALLVCRSQWDNHFQLDSTDTNCIWYQRQPCTTHRCVDPSCEQQWISVCSLPDLPASYRDCSYSYCPSLPAASIGGSCGPDPQPLLTCLICTCSEKRCARKSNGGLSTWSTRPSITEVFIDPIIPGHTVAFLATSGQTMLAKEKVIRSWVSVREKLPWMKEVETLQRKQGIMLFSSITA